MLNNKHQVNTIYLNIGGFNVRIAIEPQQRRKMSEDLSIDLTTMFKGYIVKKPRLIDFEIILQKDPHPIIFKKTSRQIKNNFLYFYKESDKKIETFVHISPLQFIFILSDVINNLLSKKNGFILHASGIKFKNQTILFTGRAGAGKSTISKFLKRKFNLLADDSVIIKNKGNNQYFAYQTPFNEKNNIGLRRKGEYKISKIFFLKKSTNLNIKKIINKEWIFSTLLKQVFVDKTYYQDNKKFLKNFSSFVNSFNEFYWLSFSKNEKKVSSFFSEFIDHNM